MRMMAGFLWLSTAISAVAALRVASIFQDHAVLQRDALVPVWGTADAGAQVTVSYDGQTVGGSADAQGRWQVTLPARPASTEGHDLEVVAGRETLTLHGVVVGDVWLCAGQSNM